jgi:5-methylcytosine-specific restriction endonuclease McrA
MLEAWVAEHGWACPGRQRPAHEVLPGGLQAEHHFPLAEGGRWSELRALCGSCNITKGRHLT